MPWCPNCKVEYSQECKICSDCHVDLVSELPGIENTVNGITPEQEAFLYTAADNNQANLIESLLRAYNIPVLRKYRGPGHFFQIYWGLTKFGIDLFVPSKQLANARNILGELPEKEVNEKFEGEELEIHRYYEKDRKIRNWFVLAFYIFSGFGLIVLLIYWLYKMTESVKFKV